jgi:hypothetical protein
MGLALFKERRITDRLKLTGLMPGRLTLDSTGEELSCRPVDVSNSGIGILIAKEIDPGTQVTLSVKNEKIELQVAWVQRDFGKQDMFRYGLVTVDANKNMESVFIKNGCLK